MQVLFTMSLDRERITRERYTVLDVMSDVGGVQGLLLTVSTVLAKVLRKNNLDDSVAARVY